LFSLAGADVVRYLNGQLSIDIKSLPPRVARPACLLNAKGKLCALLLVWSDAGSLFVECDSLLADAVQMRLERYIIADDVTISPVDPQPVRYHVFGAEPSGDALPVNRIGIPGYDTATVPQGIAEAAPELLERIRIIHGIPIWGRELNEDTLPQEARLEETAVDFHKGCYVGQETVSRLKSVGRVNKRIHGFLGTLSRPLPSRLLLHPPGQPDIAAGHLTSAVAHFDIAQTVALGYLNRQFEELPLLSVSDENGCPLGSMEIRKFPIL
jgi:folate-binding protein YgfZ